MGLPIRTSRPEQISIQAEQEPENCTVHILFRPSHLHPETVEISDRLIHITKSYLRLRGEQTRVWSTCCELSCAQGINWLCLDSIIEASLAWEDGSFNPAPLTRTPCNQIVRQDPAIINGCYSSL
jgi:hypothetical protein